MHMLLVIAFLEKVKYGGNFSPKVFLNFIKINNFLPEVSFFYNIK